MGIHQDQPNLPGFDGDWGQSMVIQVDSQIAMDLRELVVIHGDLGGSPSISSVHLYSSVQWITLDHLRSPSIARV